MAKDNNVETLESKELIADPGIAPNHILLTGKIVEFGNSELDLEVLEIISTGSSCSPPYKNSKITIARNGSIKSELKVESIIKLLIEQLETLEGTSWQLVAVQ